MKLIPIVISKIERKCKESWGLSMQQTLRRFMENFKQLMIFLLILNREKYLDFRTNGAGKTPTINMMIGLSRPLAEEL